MNQDEQEIQVSTAEQSSEYEAVPTGQDGKRKKQKKKKSGFGKGFAVGAVTMAVGKKRAGTFVCRKLR